MEMEEGHSQPKIAPKRIKLQENMEKGEEDRISELPDCVLIEILSRLPSTKEANRTGTLSKRWKHLWALVPTLIFKHCDLNWSTFAPFVDKTLTQRRQLKLKKFELHTIYDIGSESQLYYWIRYAIRCNVEELILLLCDIEYVFPLDRSIFINTCFTDLTLEGCMFNPTGAISWKNLRRLCITSGEFDEDLMENILSGSPQLKTLVLDRCYGYRRLNITSKSLKNLVFSGCRYRTSVYDNDGDFTGFVEINAPNLLSLTIQGDLYVRKLLLVNVSSLVEANLDYTHLRHWVVQCKEAQEEMLKELIVNLCHVKELKIGVSSSEVLSRLDAKGFIVPSNVKCPGVTHDRLE